MQRYNPKTIEPKWRKIWEETQIYKTSENPGDNKYYCLVMFPYPSGNLHVGHWYNFGPADAVARFNRMMGKNILHPFGFDAFGLPAENAAIKRNIPPAEWTKSNISTMKDQVASIGTMYDMDKLINTSSPYYYRWTQWLFLKLYENGLAYKKTGLVNWCPQDQTVLANEQVIGENNECDRCGTPVVQKELDQWYFKITDYADRLLEDAKELDWPERVLTMQENWIGRSTGAEVIFDVAGQDEKIKVFTTRPDTLFGATFMVLAPEHPMVAELTTAEQKQQVEEYVATVAKKTELDRKQDEKKKTGVFTGAYAINPLTKKEIPIWIGDFVLMGYGEGAIMSVPAHDQRDREFAEKYDLPIVEVIQINGDDIGAEGTVKNSGIYDDMSSSDMREKIIVDLAEQKIGQERKTYRLRDWLISRQRYWGAPIPIIYCEDCGTVPVLTDQLPVKLPEDVAFEPTGQSPLLKDDNFVNTTCPKCKKPARRETDTMDTFVDSSWYFLRYPNTQYTDGPFDPEAVKKWMPVDHYIGGIEHAILHLLYARFITKALHDHADLPFDEPFKKLSNQGMILGPDGQKMSKSKGNVVDPDDQVNSYGADSLRLYLMFMGPYDQGGPYDLGGIAGTRRFLERIWDIVESYLADSRDEPQSDKDEMATKLAIVTQKTVKKVTGDLQKLAFNTSIAALMELVNDMNRLRKDVSFAANKQEWKQSIETLLKLLSPLAPFISEELWSEMGHDKSIHLEAWPAWDEDLIKDQLVTIIVQVNGKVRANLIMAPDATEAEVIEAAQKDENIKSHLGSGEIKKTIFVKGKLVNFVV